MQTGSDFWLDDYHTHASAGVFLLTTDRRLVLQLRDDKPEIEFPGMISPFAGGAERGETPVACALRELAEETGLKAQPADLRLLGTTSRLNAQGQPLASAFFLLTEVDPDRLVVTEGRPFMLGLPDIAREPRLTPFCRRFAEMIAAGV
jgi:8-oxo-dGTP pyrophosphatase MutT (NUDIX family)